MLYSISRLKSAFALQLIGNIFIQLNDKRALSVLERAHAFEPKEPKTINNLFVIYLRDKNYQMATKMLDEYKLLSTDSERIRNLTNSLNEALIKSEIIDL